MATDDRVNDWGIDFDIGDPSYVTDPYPIWSELRDHCPVAHSDRRGGSYLPTRYDDVVAVAHDTERFSSVEVSVNPSPAGSALFVAPPITSDPPFHTEARRLLLPMFSPQAVKALEPRTQQIADELLDALDGRAVADAAADYARHLPVRVIAHMLGIPAADEDTFTGWAVSILQDDAGPDEIRRDAMREVLAYFTEQVARRRIEPGDDLISALLEARLGDAPLTDKHVLGTCALVLLAGIDTTWSAIGTSLLHLATHHHDRDRLAADPAATPLAAEELLRAYAPVTMARIAATDTEVGGCPVARGERVLLAFPAANRDPAHFDRPDEVLIDREHNRHLAFGVGVHRCLGSNLARMELRLAIDTWLRRFPRFTLVPGAEAVWGGAQVRGARNVPVLLDP